MMKAILSDLYLQRQFTKKVKGVDYYKWVVVIPPHVVKDSGWDEEWEKAHKKDKKLELKSGYRNGKIVIERKE